MRKRAVGDRKRRRDRPRLRADRRAVARGRGADRTDRRVNQHAAAGVRLDVTGRGVAHVETGLPVLNSLLTRLAETARFNLVLDIEPGDAEAEVDAAGAALGAALTRPLRAETARGYGSESIAAAEA